MQSNHRCLDLEVSTSELKITQTAKGMEVPLNAMHVSLFAEDQNGNDITCLSDHSSGSPRGSCSHGKTNSPADVEMMEDCVSELISTTSIIKKVDMQSSAATVSCMKTADDNCNQNVTFMISGLHNGNIDSESTMPDVHGLPVKKYDGIDTDAQQAFVIGSVTPSCSSSSENYNSVSSGEMLIRSNSFIIHESDQLLSASVLEESLDMPSDVGPIPGLLPDVCEGLVNNMVSATGQNSKHPDFGVTFIQPSNQTFTMEEDVFQTIPHNGPGESRASHLVAGVNHSECVTPVNLKKSHIEAERSTRSTSAEGKIFQIPTCEELDISGNAQTSTPVQSMSSKTFCFSDSPLNKSKNDFGSPLAHVMKEQQSSVCPKPKTSLTTSTKSNKLETKKYAKPDFSNIKSKIMSRPTNASKPSSATVFSASSNTRQHKNQTRPSHSMQSIASPAKSTSAISSSSTLACGRLKRDQNNVIKRTHSSTCQDTAPAPKSRPRTWSETSSSLKTSGEDTSVKEPQVGRIKNTFTNAKSSSVGGFLSRTSLTKLGDRHASSREEKCLRKPQRTSPKADSSRSVGAALCDWRKGSLGSQPLSSRAGGTSSAQTPAASLRPPPLSASKLKPGTARKNGCTTTDMPSPRSKLSTSGGNPSMRVNEGAGTEGPGGTVSRFSLPAGHQHSSASKLPMKTRTQIKSLSASSGHTKPDLESPSGALGKPPTNRTTSLRTRLQSLSPKVSSFGNKNPSSLSHASVRSAVSVSKPPASSRPARLTATFSVDKSKAKGSSRSQQQGHTNGQPDLVPPETKPRGLDYYKALCEKKNQTIQQLKNSFIASNRRFEAIAVVVQNLYLQHEESVKRRQERSVELLNLREELVSSVQSCERLEKEKEELHVAFDGVLQKVQEQHRLDLADLEERLKTFYSTEWEKIHQSYQEEAEKYKALMEQQLEELRAKHEALQKELEESHEEKVKGLKQHYEESFEELRKSHEQEMQALQKMQEDTEVELSNQIEELTTANTYFSERLKAEEDRRKELAEKCQKDSHTLYLEQELESLKVVLDIKNKQIHQQDKKLMQLDKLMEKNVKIDECLKKVQQENEDLKARMDRHAALSRQLSTEQAVLQESLQKETKVNKRLSMENEELLWKLQNGDLSSPRKISPSSPSVTLQSPRHSGLFSSPPVSPR
ncbi:microtubule-associated tumor suppressor 1 homolog A isoform X1 [Pangasianodon hypophthalmus]|uniref:microtubule-associated tumor suppressor 1 homolog A isoform X1 n=1 Tax=Pangasianodon hypophthalmus TaxID=310915 RepID=UPI002306ED32|nr:microtubule-associated tumor suppressor 1 homolog A isoform X1 [Pangasianodon hypophthalmus]XP_034161782.2 microtubule-associated tumor suppressor 1 homolog A isoform X1 [Pangasianodon hypophthalmus]